MINIKKNPVDRVKSSYYVSNNISNDAYTYAGVQFPIELGHVGYVVCRLHNMVRVFIYYYD